jgi:transposase-like protein
MDFPHHRRRFENRIPFLEVTMENQKCTAEFREEAVRQVLDRGYSVKEVAENLGVSTHSLYKWLKDVRPRPE